MLEQLKCELQICQNFQYQQITNVYVCGYPRKFCVCHGYSGFCSSCRVLGLVVLVAAIFDFVISLVALGATVVAMVFGVVDLAIPAFIFIPFALVASTVFDLLTLSAAVLAFGVILVAVVLVFVAALVADVVAFGAGEVAFGALRVGIGDLVNGVALGEGVGDGVGDGVALSDGFGTTLTDALLFVLDVVVVAGFLFCVPLPALLVAAGAAVHVVVTVIVLGGFLEGNGVILAPRSKLRYRVFQCCEA